MSRISPSQWTSCFCFGSGPVTLLVLSLLGYPSVFTCSVFHPDTFANIYPVVALPHCEVLPTASCITEPWFLIPVLYYGFPTRARFIRFHTLQWNSGWFPMVLVPDSGSYLRRTLPVPE